jgi:RNA polymerase sigma-70 factor, ECF subfamily
MSVELWWGCIGGEMPPTPATPKHARRGAFLLSPLSAGRIPEAPGCVFIGMDDIHDPPNAGLFEARYLAFLETITHLRPSLHRYCARMTGSVSDGEDVVQEALFTAYRKLDTFDDEQRLQPWLFRIAHNRCIDFLRRRGVREDAEAEAEMPDSIAAVDPAGPAVGRAVEHLVSTLPPKERACVLLKDVLDYSLEEIAALVGSTVGGVKAALNRGRSKLGALPDRKPFPARATNPETSQLLYQYVERFNQRDWDGLRELIAADARMRVVDRFAGSVLDSPYFGNYQRRTTPWRMALAEVDGAVTVISMDHRDGAWVPRSIVRLDVAGDRVVGIADYAHCPWVLAAADSLVVETYPA